MSFTCLEGPHSLSSLGEIVFIAQHLAQVFAIFGPEGSSSHSSPVLQACLLHACYSTHVSLPTSVDFQCLLILSIFVLPPSHVILLVESNKRTLNACFFSCVLFKVQRPRLDTVVQLQRNSELSRMGLDLRVGPGVPFLVFLFAHTVPGHSGTPSSSPDLAVKRDRLPPPSLATAPGSGEFSQKGKVVVERCRVAHRCNWKSGMGKTGRKGERPGS